MPEIKHSDEIQNEAVSDLKAVIDLLISISADLDANNTALGDKTLWAGRAHDVCADANKAVKNYVEEIRPVCIRMKESLDELNTNVAGFTR